MYFFNSPPAKKKINHQKIKKINSVISKTISKKDIPVLQKLILELRTSIPNNKSNILCYNIS